MNTKKKILLLTSCAAFLQVFGARQTTSNSTGKLLFSKYCVSCHGRDGTKGALGAKNLRRSTLSDESLFHKISNGGWIMPSWKRTLSPQEIQAVAVYIKTLRD